MREVWGGAGSGIGNCRGYAYIFVMVVAFVLAAAFGGMYLQVRARRRALQRQERLLKLQAAAAGAVEVFALKLKLLPYEFRETLTQKEDEENEEPYAAFLEDSAQWPGRTSMVFGGEKSVLGENSYLESDHVSDVTETINRRDLAISVIGASVESASMGSFMDALYQVRVEVVVEGTGGGVRYPHRALVRIGTRGEGGGE